VPGGNYWQHEVGTEFNPRCSQVPLPQADLDAVDDGFAVTCTEEDALKLTEDSALTADRIVDMVLVHMD
jgi:hypothetical protein